MSKRKTAFRHGVFVQDFSKGDQAAGTRKKNAAATLPRTLGPVSDLERHLPPDWWRTLFNSLYLKTDGDVVENEANTAREVDHLIKAALLEPNDRVLDVCCGQGRHCLELARRGFVNVTGLDRSRYLIRLARKRARQLGLNVSFQEGDARKLRFAPHSFHCVSMFGNSFGYFEQPSDDLAVLEAVKRVMAPGAVLLMDLVDGAWMKNHFAPRSWEWIDQEHLVCRERSLSKDGERLVCREVVVDADQGVIADQFYAERLYTAERIQKLLEEVGFERVEVNGGLATESDRAQDLGMMEHRLIVTARMTRFVPRIETTKRPVFPKVTVILGDPSLPDAVKRNGKFNEEDFETIKRLHDALDELADYSFTYLNKHSSLRAELRRERPQFVFNLCDEGFNNDPFKELHVPALLEMFEIPYSGAGPACLGLCYNKAFVRAIAASMDVPVPLETYFEAGDQSATIPSVFPALLKPNTGDSSLGITKDAVVHTPEQLLTYLGRLREEFPDRAVIVQEFLTGPEYSVGIVGNPGLSYHVLPVLEVDYSGLDPDLPRILGYESKWIPDSPYWTQIRYREARLHEDARRKLIDHSTLLFERLGCRDYARFDWRTDAQGEIKLLEANPNPGWCWDGKLNFMAGFEGLRYADLLRLIIEAAQARAAAEFAMGEQFTSVGV